MSEVEETMSVVGYEWSDCSKCKNLFCKKAGTQESVYCNHLFEQQIGIAPTIIPAEEGE